MGRVPVPIAVELTDDLVGALAPGDVATVVGVVKVQAGDAGEAAGPGRHGGAADAAGGGVAAEGVVGQPLLALILSSSHPHAPCTCVCHPPPLAAGKKGGGKPKDQCLFLPYIQAVGVQVAGKENTGPAAQQQAQQPGQQASQAVGAEEGDGLNFLPPNMPGFTETDLKFICAFTEVGGACMLVWGGETRERAGVSGRAAWLPSAPARHAPL